MKKIIECVLNFSEGRRKNAIEELAAALAGPPGVALLDTHADPAHNRCVISVAGDPEGVAAGAIAAVGRASELIDLRTHRGEHPRMGAADVVPFIPIANVTMAECVDLSIRVAQEIARRYDIPVYLYEQSARVAARRDLAYVRRGEFEGLREEIATNPERRPDFGPLKIHASAGATAVGARYPLIAYNVYLNTADLNIARSIARTIRASSGGLPYVKALGFEIKERGLVQVSMNLIRYAETPVYRAFEAVAREAERHGVLISSSEIVGLIPQQALDACAAHYLRLEGFGSQQILENRLDDTLPPVLGVEELLSNIAAATPAPGGGSVGALAGALAAALGSMVAGLTMTKKKFEAVAPRMRELHAQLARAQNLLYRLSQEDADAYREVIAALKLPAGSGPEKELRSAALQIAIRHATEVPLSTARAAFEVVEGLGILVETGNPNARSDAAAGAVIAAAALKSAQYNVWINISSLKDKDFAGRCRREVDELAARSLPIVQRIDRLMAGG
jgi:glutamate formiminotransferase/formiminotetrahydrofolate cyclodeaminase